MAKVIGLQVTFGERVRAHRIALGWSQAKLAAKLKRHQPDICDLENGRHAPKLDTVQEIARVLKVPARALLE